MLLSSTLIEIDVKAVVLGTVSQNGSNEYVIRY